MPRGGYRPGAGAKPGGKRVKMTAEEKIANKVKRRTAELIAERAAQEVVEAATGDITPVGVMLQTMRHLWHKAQPDPAVIGGEIDLEFAKQAVVAAAQVAPYVHRKLAPYEPPPIEKPPAAEIDVQESARRIAFVFALGSQKAIEHKSA